MYDLIDDVKDEFTIAVDSGYFELHELIPEHLYNRFYKTGWSRFIDPLSFIGLCDLRRDFGKPFTINNYFWGGPREWSGLRTPGTPYYSEASMHARSKAFDIVGPDPAALQDYVRDHYAEYGIGGLEIQEGWTHIDFRWNPTTLVVFD